MFEVLPLTSAATVGIEINGDALRVPVHFTVAAALLANGQATCRTSAVSGAPRGPFCMMGVCFECLVEIDGVPNVQACITRVAEGMRVRSMHGKARLV